MINISFISQEKTLFEGQAEMVVMDGKDGQLGIVKGHSPLLAILKPGPVRMITEDNEEVFFTEGGFAEVQPDNITILVDSAQRADDLDEAKILKAKEVKHNGNAGEIIDPKFVIACSENAIQILEIQKEGKKKMNIEEYLKGNSLILGSNVS